MPEPVNTYGIVTILLGLAGLWIREWFKHRDWKKKNGGLERIESDVAEIKGSAKSLDSKTQKIDKDVGIIKKDVTNIHYNCKKYEHGITQNARDILNLHKEKADK